MLADDKFTKVDAILCTDWIAKQTSLNNSEKVDLLTELNQDYLEYQLCPDIETYYLNQGTRTTSG